MQRLFGGDAYSRVALFRVNTVFVIWCPSVNPPGVGGGGLLNPETQTLTLSNTIFYQNGTPFISLAQKLRPFLIPQGQAKAVEYPMVATFPLGQTY